MLAVRVIVLCIAAALLCTVLRVHRPELALAMSLAVGLMVMLMVLDPVTEVASQLRRFLHFASLEGEGASIVLKAAGIAILSELGVQICCDAGESALAGRIRLVSRLTMLGLSMPLVGQIMDGLSSLLGSF